MELECGSEEDGGCEAVEAAGAGGVWDGEEGGFEEECVSEDEGAIYEDVGLGMEEFEGPAFAACDAAGGEDVGEE